MIISIHIPKTGGMSFATLLEQAYLDGCFLDYSSKTTEVPYWYAYFRAFVRSFARARFAESVECVHGHFFAIQYSRLQRPYHFVTWLRDPVEQHVSLYYYWKRYPDISYKHPLWLKMIEKSMTLREFAEIPRFWNIATRFLYGVPLRSFSFVGIMEQYDRSIALFKRIFSIGDDVWYARTNVNPDRKAAKYQLDPDLFAYVCETNGKDMMLYQQGLRRFEELCDQFGV